MSNRDEQTDLTKLDFVIFPGELTMVKRRKWDHYYFVNS